MTERTYCIFVPSLSNDHDRTDDRFNRGWTVSNYLGTDPDEPVLFTGTFEECEGFIGALHFAVTERGKELLEGMWKKPE